VSLSMSAREDALKAKINEIICDLSGLEDDDLAGNITFMELGFDSLFMTQLSGAFQKISYLVLALMAYGTAEILGGNGFIAAFCMGITAANTSKKESTESLYEYAEVEVQGLMLAGRYDS